MNHDWPADFESQYQIHLKRLRLAGLRPKTIEAYSQGAQRAGLYFCYRRPKQMCLQSEGKFAYTAFWLINSH